jgi:hypothetical protein
LINTGTILLNTGFILLNTGTKPNPAIELPQHHKTIYTFPPLQRPPRPPVLAILTCLACSILSTTFNIAVRLRPALVGATKTLIACKNIFLLALSSFICFIFSTVAGIAFAARL